jgi:hypothetical protein
LDGGNAGNKEESSKGEHSEIWLREDATGSQDFSKMNLFLKIQTIIPNGFSPKFQKFSYFDFLTVEEKLSLHAEKIFFEFRAAKIINGGGSSRTHLL